MVIEAATAGTPSVVYNIPGFSEAVQHEHTGLLCPENTPENMAETLRNLLQDRALYDNLQKNAQNHGREFTFAQATEQFLQRIS